ncbi:MAG: N-acetylgalactosamine 6-sulfate sulfatase [Flavobacteriales bacterium]|nr:N-acetylgalactosamine 6-sulfate sulfatase [Flavobacteriales bacterium]
MKNIIFLICLFLFSCNSKKNDLPNVIIIFADDLGYNDISFHGTSDISTPNIDNIGKNGVFFTSGYLTTPFCSPSRAGLITGRYPDSFGYGRNILFAPKDPNMGLPITEFTIADLFKTKNYKTGIIGKWHLGAHESLRPNSRGFDEFFGHLTGGHRYLPEELTLQDETKVKAHNQAYRTKILRNKTRVDIDDYLTDEFSDEAVKFIENNSDNPFFLYLPYNAPHGPIQAPEKYVNRFPNIKNPLRKVYAGMISSMDDGIGKIVSKLKEQNIYNNTIIFFLSDNGAPKKRWTEKERANYPFSGYKGSDLGEGGVRTPFFMQWPNKIKAQSIYNNPVSSFDIFATMKSIINPDFKLPNQIHGKNILPYVLGENSGKPHESLFWKINGDFKIENNDTIRGNPRFAIRSNNYKMIVDKDGNNFLYDLDKDISEKDNIALEFPEIVNELRKKIDDWNQKTIHPVFLGLANDKLYNKLNPNRFKY